MENYKFFLNISSYKIVVEEKTIFESTTSFDNIQIIFRLFVNYFGIFNL